MAGQTRRGPKNSAGPRKRATKGARNGASDGSGPMARRSTSRGPGAGQPLLLLHGWPEFWLTWEPVMTRLADRFTLYRARPARLRRQRQARWAVRPRPACRRHAGVDGCARTDAGRYRRPRRRRRADAAAGADGAGSASPDCSSSTSSIPASGRGWRSRSGSTTSGISRFTRWRWRLPWSAPRAKAAGLYIGHFLKAWSHRKDAFDDVLEAFTDNFLKPGNLAGGFAHYRAAHAGRIRMMKGESARATADRRADLRSLGRA